MRLQSIISAAFAGAPAPLTALNPMNASVAFDGIYSIFRKVNPAYNGGAFQYRDNNGSGTLTTATFTETLSDGTPVVGQAQFAGKTAPIVITSIYNQNGSGARNLSSSVRPVLTLNAFTDYEGNARAGIDYTFKGMFLGTTSTYTCGGNANLALFFLSKCMGYGTGAAGTMPRPGAYTTTQPPLFSIGDGTTGRGVFYDSGNPVNAEGSTPGQQSGGWQCAYNMREFVSSKQTDFTSGRLLNSWMNQKGAVVSGGAGTKKAYTDRTHGLSLITGTQMTLGANDARTLTAVDTVAEFYIYNGATPMSDTEAQRISLYQRAGLTGVLETDYTPEADTYYPLTDQGPPIGGFVFGGDNIFPPNQPLGTLAANQYLAWSITTQLPDWPVDEIEMSFSNWYSPNIALPAAYELNTGNAISNTASVYVNGVYRGDVCTDNVIVDGDESPLFNMVFGSSNPAPAGAIVNIRGHVSIPGGAAGNRPAAYDTRYNPDKFQGRICSTKAEAEAIRLGGAITNNLTGSNSAVYGPSCLFAKGYAGGKVVKIDGTSIAYGNGVQSYVLNMFNGAEGKTRIPHASFAVQARSGSDFYTNAQGKYKYKDRILKQFIDRHGYRPYTHHFIEHIVNDADDTTVGGTVIIPKIQYFQKFMYYRYGKPPIIQCTAPPKINPVPGVNSDNVWLCSHPSIWTHASDNANCDRWAGSAYIATNPFPQTAYFDSRFYYTGSSSGTRWSEIPGNTTLAEAASVGDITIKTNAIPPLRTNLVHSGGNSALVDDANGEGYFVDSYTGTGPYLITLNKPLVKAAASGAELRGRPTVEGVHVATSDLSRAASQAGYDLVNALS